MQGAFGPARLVKEPHPFVLLALDHSALFAMNNVALT